MPISRGYEGTRRGKERPRRAACCRATRTFRPGDPHGLASTTQEFTQHSCRTPDNWVGATFGTSPASMARSLLPMYGDARAAPLTERGWVA